MQFQKQTFLTQSQKFNIHELWNREYPANLIHSSFADFEEYLSMLQEPSHVLVLDENDEFCGWYFDFKREGERWFAMIVDSKFHKKGIGRKLLNMAKEKHKVLLGWVIDHNNDVKSNGMVYPSPLGFYLKNDFRIMKESRLELEKISAVKIQWRQ